MTRVLRFLCLALLAVSSLRADVELAFAVPDDGRVTLGVFNDAGKLVRVLHRLARQEEFRIGLNGFITSWDGKNDAGERMPAGHYYVRGYLIGEEVKVAGEDFLFHDWAADGGFPGFSRIHDFSMLESGDLILLAGDESRGYLLTRFSPAKGFLWTAPLQTRVASSGKRGPAGFSRKLFQGFQSTDPAGRPLGGSAIVESETLLLLPTTPRLTTNSKTALVISDLGLDAYDLETGNSPFFAPAGGGMSAIAMAANESQVFVSSSGGLTTFPLPDLSHLNVTPTPAAFTAMDADASTLVGASPAGVWIRREAFAPVTLPATVRSVALGMPGTFWFVGEEGGAAFVGQAAFSGEILRLLRPAAGDPKPEIIRASRTMEKFTVLESLPGLQRLRVMTRSEGGEWTIDWERSLWDTAAFGFVDGAARADAGNARQEKEIRFRLKENPLTGKKDFLTVRGDFDATGSRLVSPDGLPLVEISSRQDIRRQAMQRGNTAGTLRWLQGNGIFVEEFSLTGLHDILPLDAGGIDLP